MEEIPLLVLAKSSFPIFLSLSTDFFAQTVLACDLNNLKHIGMSFPCDLLQLVVPSLEVVVLVTFCMSSRNGTEQ